MTWADYVCALRSFSQALANQLHPLSRALTATKAAEAMQVVVQKPPETVETAGIAETAEATGEGDITQALAADMTALEKKQLVDKLNRSASKERADAMRGEFLASAAGTVL